MAGRGHDEGRLCRCDRADGGCAGLAVRRLSPERVWELAEELWTVSSGDLLSAHPATMLLEHDGPGGAINWRELKAGGSTVWSTSRPWMRRWTPSTRRWSRS